MTVFQLRYEGSPDDRGCRRFVMFWSEPHGVFRHEPSKQDGLPVGFRRGQYFFAHPEEHIRSLESRGHTVEVLP